MSATRLAQLRDGQEIGAKAVAVRPWVSLTAAMALEAVSPKPEAVNPQPNRPKTKILKVYFLVKAYWAFWETLSAQYRLIEEYTLSSRGLDNMV